MTTPDATPRAMSFDARALTEPVDKGEVARFDRELKARFGSARLTDVATVILIVFALVFVGGAGLTGLAGAIASSVVEGGAFAWPALILPMLFMLTVAALIVLALVNGHKGKETRYRLARFARANAMSFIPVLADPKLPGLLFHQGHSRMALNLLRGEQPRFVEFGNYRYTTGSGKNKSTHTWGYVAIHLDAPLPHIVLDALSNNALGLSNLPATFDKEQRLSLEGDFDRHFALYCPEGYERDALYLFTPDIMARFLDNAAQLDVEIVDDWMFLYTRRPVSTTDPGTWAWLFSVVSALMDKLAQWGRWRDERLGAPALAPAPGTTPAQFAAAQPVAPAASPLPFGNPAFVRPPKGVAAEGRRLKRGFSWATLVVIVVALVFFLMQNFGHMILGFLVAR
ncbi:MULTISPECIES: hypothetical protein [unclassified Microbacterium]|uniref:hypothetical protein n=1 Tax=unclassified Microbacterium TaxID=2609290 RepID=UPI000AD6EF40|nr:MULTISPECIES: hypothetical protein [unclassified Microbacterium]